MKTGVPPTALNARTGEFTPPGNSACARSNRLDGARALGRRGSSPSRLPSPRRVAVVAGLVVAVVLVVLALVLVVAPSPRRPDPPRPAAAPAARRARRPPRARPRLALFLLGDALHGDDLLGSVALPLQADEAHALRVAADGRDAVDRHADQLAAVGDQHQVVVVGDQAQADHLAVALGGLDGDDALAAAVLGRVVGRRRALAVAVLAHGEQRRRLLARDDRHADHLVVVGRLAQPDAAHAARRCGPSAGRSPRGSGSPSRCACPAARRRRPR